MVRPRRVGGVVDGEAACPRCAALASAAGEAGQDDAGGHHASGDGGRLGEFGGRLGVALLGTLPGLLCLLGPASGPLAQSAGAGLRLLTQTAGPGRGLLTQMLGLGARLLAQMLPGLPRLRTRVDPRGELDDARDGDPASLGIVTVAGLALAGLSVTATVAAVKAFRARAARA